MVHSIQRLNYKKIILVQFLNENFPFHISISLQLNLFEYSLNVKIGVSDLEVVIFHPIVTLVWDTYNFISKMKKKMKMKKLWEISFNHTVLHIKLLLKKKEKSSTIAIKYKEMNIKIIIIFIFTLIRCMFHFKYHLSFFFFYLYKYFLWNIQNKFIGYANKL